MAQPTYYSTTLYPNLYSENPPPTNPAWTQKNKGSIREEEYTQAEYHSPAPTKSIVNQEIHERTEALLSIAKNLADSILRPVKTSETHTRQSTSADHSWWPLLLMTTVTPRSNNYNQQVVHIHNDSHHYVHHKHHHHHLGKKQEEKEKSDVVLRLFIGVISVGVGFISVYVLGKTLAEQENLKDEKYTFKELKDEWGIDPKHQQFYSTKYQKLVECIIEHVGNIFKRKQNDKFYNLCLLISGMTAAGLGIAGSVMASEALILSALAVGGVALGLTLFKLGFSSSSTSDQKDARAIEAALDSLKKEPVKVEIS